LAAFTSTYTDFNNSVITETSLMVEPLYNEFWDWGQFGLKDGEIGATINLTKKGTILGIHQIDNFSYNTITDKTNGNIEYEIVPNGSSVNITEVNQETIKGKINPGLLLMTPTEHDRFDFYPRELRKES
jgi:hypothetical protein